MFKQEMYGYSKSDVDKYLSDVLEKLEGFEKIIEEQKNEIQALEKRLEVINTSDSSDEIIEKAKVNADKIIFQALENARDLQSRIDKAIEQELLK